MVVLRTTLLLATGFVLAGCQLNRLYGPPGTIVRPLADGYFFVSLEPSQVKDLGGPGSASLAAYVDQEVVKSGVCKGAHRVEPGGWGRGEYVIKGACR